MQGRCRSCKSATPVETWHAAAAAAVSRRRAFTLAGLGTTTHGGRSATATRAHTAQSGHSTCFLIDCAPAPVPAPAPLREEHPAGELSTIPALASWSLRCQHTVIQVKNIWVGSKIFEENRKDGRLEVPRHQWRRWRLIHRPPVSCSERANCPSCGWVLLQFPCLHNPTICKHFASQTPHRRVTSSPHRVPSPDPADWKLTVNCYDDTHFAVDIANTKFTSQFTVLLYCISNPPKFYIIFSGKI